jgi:membrane-associated phospholipid phosphatase
MKTERRRTLGQLLGVDRFNIFVPAVMGVGLVFWLVTELNELARARSEESRDRRARVAALAIADSVLARPPQTPPSARGLRPRPVYLMIGVTMVAGSIFVLAGSIANYTRQEGNVGDIAWIVALAAVVVAVAGLFGVTALAVFVRWPTPPDSVVGFVMRTPLGTEPLDPRARLARPSWRLTAALLAVTALAATIALLVAWSPHVLTEVDRSTADWLADRDPLRALTFLDPIGESGVAIALALLAGLAAVRCRVLTAAFAMATVVGLLISVTLRPLVAQPRPGGGPLAGRIDSFPSGHVLLAVIIAGLLPLAVAVIFNRTWIVTPLRVVLGTGVIASALHRVAEGIHWPTDALGGALMGLGLVLAAQWMVDNQESHRACHHCPWSADPAHGELLGAVPIHPSAHQALRLFAHLAAAAGAIGLTLVTFTVDLPVDADGYTLGREAQTTAQLALAALVSIGALIAWKWDGAGAVVLALAATGVGIFAAAEYRPPVGVALTAVMMIPALLLWLSWQHRRRPHEVVALAVVTAVLVGSSWVGASAVSDHFFGPTHPASAAVDPGRDEVDWVWAGALHAEGVTVTARVPDGEEPVRLLVEPEGGDSVMTAPTLPDEYGLVRMRVDGLTPDTEHTYRVVVEAGADRRRGGGRFRTPAVGPFSFRVTAGACARTGSNGAVFDAIRAEEPLLHLALGDMHYENLESTDPQAFLDAYGRALTTPAQSALARAVPSAYVWDDHDYGPNDADATSPGREAAREAYRAAVPHYDVPPGNAPINQAFTIGRVRFVLTDTRSEKQGSVMLGQDQLDWLLTELRTSARTHAALIWVNAVPWIGEADPDADGWAGAATERRVVADAIADAGIDNLVMVSGDAHMVAVDDGTNSDYSTGGGAVFPVLHAAALDRPGNVKGGPYSHGAFPGAGQYGALEIDDDGGDEITVRLIGKNWEGETLVTHEHPITLD